MAVETFHALDDLIAAADARLDGFDCVSIDVFDTLFVRRIHDPDEVKRPVAKLIADVARREGIRISADRVWRLRDAIEGEQRAHNGNSFPDFEARYDDFMRELLLRVFDGRPPEGFLEEVGAFEMRIESAMIVVRSALAAWLERLERAGKRVFLVSDIYLPAAYLERLVADKALDGCVEAVVSSADSFHAKASGSAWPLMRDRYGLEPERWLHVGDHPISDGVRPDEFGIHAMVLRDRDEKQRLDAVRGYATTQDETIHRGRYVQQLMSPLEGEHRNMPALYGDGHGFLGPVLGFFCLSVLEYCREHAVERLYFCSREGWSLMRVFEEMMPYVAPEGGLPEASYLYVSRLAVTQASCARTGLTELGASVALLPGSSRDFRDVCRVFRLDVESLRPFLERHRMTADEPIARAAPGKRRVLRQRFRELLGDEAFQREVEAQARPAQRELEGYLSQEGFFDHGDVALVDIGWLGTIQHFLVEAIRHRPDTPRVHGLLLSASRLVSYRDDHASRVHGLVHDGRRPGLSESLVETVKELFEEACRAPHPSVMGYRRRGSEVKPVFRDVGDADALAEKEQDEYYAPLRQGVFDAASRFGAAVAVAGSRACDLEPWLRSLLTSRIAFPTTAAVERMRHRSHQDDFAGRHEIPRKALRANRTLWGRSLARLRFDPFVRRYYYLLHTWRLRSSRRHRAEKTGA